MKSTEYPNLSLKRSHTNPVILNLQEEHRPENVVCTSCPHSQWFTTNNGGGMQELTCYCPLMSAVVYESVKPIQILDCSGLYMEPPE